MLGIPPPRSILRDGRCNNQSAISRLLIYKRTSAASPAKPANPAGTKTSAEDFLVALVDAAAAVEDPDPEPDVVEASLVDFASEDCVSLR